jgi:transposase
MDPKPPNPNPLSGVDVSQLTKILDYFKSPDSPYMIFRGAVYDKIDENVFLPLYSNTGAPGVSPRVMFSIMIYQKLHGLSDEAMILELDNYGVKCAVGLDDGGKVSEKTLYNFRDRLCSDKSGAMDALMDSFVKSWATAYGIKTDYQRADTTYFSSNMREHLSRVELTHNVLHLASRAIPESLRPAEIKEVFEPGYRSAITYRSGMSAEEKQMILLGKCCVALKALEALPEGTPGAKSGADILKRFLSEQAIVTSDWGLVSVKIGDDLNSGCIQSAYDTDATYREKDGKRLQGYDAFLSETCSRENPFQLITGFDIRTNNVSDVDIVLDNMARIVASGGEVLVADGGFAGSRVLDKADEFGVEMRYTNLTGKKTSKLSSTQLVILGEESDSEVAIKVIPALKLASENKSEEAKKADETTPKIDTLEKAPATPAPGKHIDSDTDSDMGDNEAEDKKASEIQAPIETLEEAPATPAPTKRIDSDTDSDMGGNEAEGQKTGESQAPIEAPVTLAPTKRIDSDTDSDMGGNEAEDPKLRYPLTNLKV